MRSADRKMSHEQSKIGRSFMQNERHRDIYDSFLERLTRNQNGER